MNDEKLKTIKKNIIAIGRLLWEKDLASGLNGNISARVDETSILLTATKTCLGLLQEKDILHVDLQGKVLEEGAVSTEKLLHTGIYRQFEETRAVIHTHTVFTNAYFLENTSFQPRNFESRIWFGTLKALEQHTPCVTDVQPVLAALKENNIAVLRQHGAIAMGRDLFDCFLLIQCLEDAVKVDAISKLYRGENSADRPEKTGRPAASEDSGAKAFELFSPQQMKAIVALVNDDARLKELGEKTKMTMDLAVQLNETGQVYSFRFENGRITRLGHDAQAEFLISAPASVWRDVFNRRIDPFVATTQKKMLLRGDFAKISQWYEPCCRIFELWQQVPIA